MVYSSQPFNAFLSGFGAAVGQFVLTASLRMQTSAGGSGSKPSSKGKNARFADESEEGTGYSHERWVCFIRISNTFANCVLTGPLLITSSGA